MSPDGAVLALELAQQRRLLLLVRSCRGCLGLAACRPAAASLRFTKLLLLGDSDGCLEQLHHLASAARFERTSSGLVQIFSWCSRAMSMQAGLE